MTEGAQFPNILLGARGTTASGALNVNDAGITWKKDGGMNPQVFKKEDIAQVIWSRAPGGCLLRIRQHDKVTINLHGFSTGDEARLKDDLSNFLGMGLASQEMDASGHNWGQLQVHGSSLAFESMEGKHIFELPLTEIGDVQGTKEDVILEFHIDDGTISQKEDGLCSITFVVPDDNQHFPAEDGRTGAEVFKEAIMGKTDALAGEGDALAELEHVACIFPRGRYDLSIFPSFMVMDGQNSQFRIRYSNIDRIYQLPRPQPAGNLVLVHLENAIRRGQTYYEWIAFFFDANAYVDDLNLNATEEFLTKKNGENRANMELVMSGPKEDVLTRLLRGLSGAKVTKQGKFTASDDSPFLSCNHRNDAGVLYPLQRAFLYTFKPELIPYDHISSVEFERQQSGMHAATVRTFDLSVSIKPEAATRTKSFLFRGIMKQEWEPLLNFMEEKNIRISNLDQARQGPGFAPAAPLAGMDLGGDEDEEDDEFGGEGMAEEDGDFDAGGGSGSDSSDNDSDAELIPEEGISVEAVGGKASKRARKEVEDDDEVENEPVADDDDDASEEASEEEASEEEEEKPKKKPAKKAAKPKAKAAKEDAPAKKGKKAKDPDAPKRGASAFMHFSSAKRAEVKENNPGIAFGEVGKKLGEMWKSLTPDDKAPFEKLAAKDKARYEKEKEAYEKKQKA